MLFEVAFLDIGHGDCTVITFTEPDGAPRCIVIDGGEEGAHGVQSLQPDAPIAAQRLAAYLKLRGVRRIDLLIGTHIDSDHIGGLVALLRDYTAKQDSQGGAYWNDRRLCIGQYWGPLSDAYWGLIGREQGHADAERRRYQEMMRLLAKLKVKKRKELTAADRAEMARLQCEIDDLRRKVDELLQSHRARAYLQRSIGQNWALGELLRQHVADPERDLLAPDLTQPPVSPFESVEIDLLWPDVQLPDTMIEPTWLRPVEAERQRIKPWAQNAPRRRRPQLALADVLQQIMDHQEQLARKEDRKANNRSLVMRVRPKSWAGDPAKWPVLLLTGDAESESWQRIVSRARQGELAAYILKAPHHGSAAANGLTAEALRAIAPRFVVISVGQIHCLPAAETLNLLRAGAAGPLDIFCTERNHNPALQAACWTAPAGCVRQTPADYRGVIFSFNTARGNCAVIQLQLTKKEEGYALRPVLVRDPESDPHAILWCRQCGWT